MYICEQLKSIRPVGRVSCQLYHGSQILPRKQRLKSLNFQHIPDELWYSVSRQEAITLISKAICVDSNGDEVLPFDHIEPLVESFFSSIPDDVTLYSCMDCITHDCIDTAVMAENNGVLALICVADPI